MSNLESIELAPTAFPKTRTLRLAAIDLDGTLLGPDLGISPENLRAIERLQQAGMEVVLASGRHYHSIRPFAERIPGIRWVLSAQGAEVASLGRENVLRRLFLEPDEVREILDMAHRLGFSAVLYTPAGIFTESTDEDVLRFYSHLTGIALNPASHGAMREAATFKIVWVGDPDRISGLRTLEEIEELRIQKVHSNERLYEFMPTEVSKGTGLAVLTEALGIAPEHVVVFGDAENDIPMFDWAGTSVAMDHGWPAAKAAASLVTPGGAPETAFARAVDLVL